MIEQQNPITPPHELVKQWTEYAGLVGINEYLLIRLATQAAQWGADQELEACCEWLDYNCPSIGAHHLRAARRPKPPSLKEQALKALAHILNNSSTELGAETIRCALEALPDD